MSSFTNILYLTLTLCCSLHLYGQGFQVNFQGQKQQGMGCAGTATYADASTLFFNPGAAAFAHKSEINLATTPIFATVHYTDSATQENYTTNNPVGTPFSAYGLYRFKNK